MSKPQKKKKNKNKKKVGLQILAHHAHLYKQSLFQKYEECYILLQRMANHKNPDLRKTAMRALESFLLQISEILGDSNKAVQDEEIISFWVKTFYFVFIPTRAKQKNTNTNTKQTISSLSTSSPLY